MTTRVRHGVGRLGSPPRSRRRMPRRAGPPLAGPLLAGLLLAGLLLVGAGQASLAAGLPVRLVATAAARADQPVSLGDASFAGSTRAPAAVFPEQTGATRRWLQGDTGQGVGVAVVDTGIQDLPDFAGRLIGGVDLTGQGDPFSDGHGHGTFVAPGNSAHLVQPVPSQPTPVGATVSLAGRWLVSAWNGANYRGSFDGLSWNGVSWNEGGYG